MKMRNFVENSDPLKTGYIHFLSASLGTKYKLLFIFHSHTLHVFFTF